MDTRKILSYLSDLENNNNREWYHDNKQLYKEANDEFEQLIQEFILCIGGTDKSILLLSPKESTFKLVQNTGPNNDKAPYNPTFRAHIAAKGRLPIPVGYYISIRPDNRSFIGGGLYKTTFNKASIMVRDYIMAHGNEFMEIIYSRAFADVFSVKGEVLKSLPHGFDKKHPQAEYLKKKSWYLQYPIADSLLLEADVFFSEAVSNFILMQPFNSYLNKALKGF